MIDSHAHLVHPDFDADREAVIQRALQAGVNAIINVGYDLKSSRKAVEQAARHTNLFAAVGVHPHEASTWNESYREELEELCADTLVVAVGETGLDYHYDFSPREAQERAFREQIRLARELGLPLIIHSRAAEGDALRILEQEGEGKVCGVFHCFTGSLVFARQCVSAGFHLGFTGIITFPKSNELRKVVAEVPLTRILLETDCPYLAPEGMRGKRNEPSYLATVAQAIAALKHCCAADVVKTTTKNTIQLFPRLSAGNLSCSEL